MFLEPGIVYRELSHSHMCFCLLSSQPATAEIMSHWSGTPWATAEYRRLKHGDFYTTQLFQRLLPPLDFLAGQPGFPYPTVWKPRPYHKTQPPYIHPRIRRGLWRSTKCACIFLEGSLLLNKFLSFIQGAAPMRKSWECFLLPTGLLPRKLTQIYLPLVPYYTVNA